MGHKPRRQYKEMNGVKLGERITLEYGKGNTVTYTPVVLYKESMICDVDNSRLEGSHRMEGISYDLLESRFRKH